MARHSVAAGIPEGALFGGHSPTPYRHPAGIHAPRHPTSCGLLAFGGRVIAGNGLDVDQARPRLHLPRQEREVLPQRMALEPGRQVDVAYAGVPVELEPEHLPRLPLVPVGATEDLDDRF